MPGNGEGILTSFNSILRARGSVCCPCALLYHHWQYLSCWWVDCQRVQSSGCCWPCDGQIRCATCTNRSAMWHTGWRQTPQTIIPAQCLAEQYCFFCDPARTTRLPVEAT